MRRGEGNTQKMQRNRCERCNEIVATSAQNMQQACNTCMQTGDGKAVSRYVFETLFTMV
jgi:formylmethanofuran dehydrogenase subunit E